MLRVVLLAGALAAANIVQAQGAPAGGAPITMSSATQRSYANIKRFLIAAAEKMAADDYQFRPTPEVRSFLQAIGHVANSQFATCARARGESNPSTGVDYERASNKDEVVRALVASFAFCDPAYAALTDEWGAGLVAAGQTQVARGALLSNNVSHNNEMYGVIGVYMRLKGLVPPSTEAARQARTP